MTLDTALAMTSAQAENRKRSASASPETMSKRTRKAKLGLFVHCETSGLDPKTNKVLEVALKVLEMPGGREVCSYDSTVKIDRRNWNKIDPKALEVNGLTWDLVGVKGKSISNIAREIVALTKEFKMTPENTTLICHNKDFEVEFLNQVFPTCKEFPALDLKDEVTKKVGQGAYPGITLQNFMRAGRNDIARILKLQKVPNPHSAMSITNQIISIYNKIFPLFLEDPARVHHIDTPVYQGINRLRDTVSIEKVAQDPSKPFLSLPGEMLGMIKGTPKWNDWVKEGVDSSEIIYIAKQAPMWKTPLQLYKEKRGERQAAPLSDHQKAAAAKKVLAKYAFMEATGIEIQPKCFQSDQYEEMGATIDGVNKDGTIIVKFICPSDWTKFQAGSLPKMYLYKIQMELFCQPTAQYALAWIWDPTKGGILIKVLPDAELQEEIIDMVGDFQSALIQGRPPGELAADKRVALLDA